MRTSRVRIILTTFPANDEKRAKELAQTLVRNRWAGCVWVLPQMFSVYHWEGNLTEDREMLVVVKTDIRQCKDAENAIKRLHPYSVPEIITLKPENVHKDYEAWLTSYLSEPESKNP
ncbi:MAG: divalent-cation tolerance protein CutA [bacterium JZ-2024 1]